MKKVDWYCRLHHLKSKQHEMFHVSEVPEQECTIHHKVKVIFLNLSSLCIRMCYVLINLIITNMVYGMTSQESKGLLHYFTFGYKTFWSCLSRWGRYTEGSKKFQPLVYMWSKPTPSFSHVGALLLKIRAFFWAPDFATECEDALEHSQPVIITHFYY